MGSAVLPRSFLDGPVDKDVLNQTLITSRSNESQAAVYEALAQQDVAKALKVWSNSQEEGFKAAACHCDGEARKLSKKYFGRCQVEKPKMVQLALPRCRTCQVTINRHTRSPRQLLAN